MGKIGTKYQPRRLHSAAGLLSLVFVITLSVGGGVALAAPPVARQAITSPGLGAADPFAVLAGSAVNDTNPSTILGDVGLSPAAWVSALTCLEVTGTIYSVDGSGPLPCRVTNAGLLTTAKNDLGTAYDNLALADNALCTTDYGVGPQDLTLVSPLGPGVYCVGAGGFQISGTLNLSGSGVWIFRSATTIITASNSTVAGGGDTCDVWWRAESSVTLGTDSTFVGNILALASITDNGGSTITGRLLARNQAVTLNNTTVNRPDCAPATNTPTATATSTNTATATATSTATLTPTLTATATRTPFFIWTRFPSSDPNDTGTDGIGSGGVGGAGGGNSLLPTTGVNLAEERALAARRWMQIGLGLLGLSLVVLGFALRRKPGK